MLMLLAPCPQVDAQPSPLPASPVIHPDGSVSFFLQAPDAQNVTVNVTGSRNAFQKRFCVPGQTSESTWRVANSLRNVPPLHKLRAAK